MSKSKRRVWQQEDDRFEYAVSDTQSSSPNQSIYRMGKLRSKFLILDVFGYAGYAQTKIQYIGQINHNLRDLLINNYSIIHQMI